ncbi:probable calcium-binding protein CML25 [Cajanus cajan]|uniref:Calcium-binding protein CML25 n=1 Tax=Cajanus cajan TaxID=3821 RepID=A0A151S400_CAJCA|nr:probable calcium-binding protein CML25 [Cajanus cajan]KYP49494.1 putative calcium-binding protein CML25 [Cajanus cajan]
MGFRSLFCRKRKMLKTTSSSSASTSSTSALPTAIPGSGRGRVAEELEYVFKKFDVNGDGKISSSELGSMMRSLGQAATEEELSKMIGEVDADGDGHISLEEFIELNTKGVDPDEVLENLRDAFSIFDIDGNGSITVEELHMVMASLGDQCSVDDCRKMIAGVDADGDGTIDFDEFKIMMTASASASGEFQINADNKKRQ